MNEVEIQHLKDEGLEHIADYIAELEAILIDTYNSFTVDMGRIKNAIPELKEHK